jgi:hypothetical protein
MRTVWAFVVVGVIASAGRARAGGPEAASAEAAFDKGRDLMKAGLYQEACASFDESERLDPQIGTLYNLADCWEKVGKLASSWTAYREVAQRDSNATRRKAADDHAKALAPRLPKLVIHVQSPVPGLLVTLNGGDVTKLVGVEAPMDLGTYAIVVSAKGYQAWGGEAKLDHEGVKVTIEVPKLSPGNDKQPPAIVVKPVAPPPVHPIPPGLAPAPAPAHASTLPIVVMTGGGALIAGGLVFGVMAQGKLSDAEKICPNKQCGSTDDQMRANELLGSSRSRGTVSTALVAVGAAAVIGGGVWWWTTRDHGEHAPRTAFAPYVDSDGAGFVLAGSF